jgi:hypothetical protein
MIDDNQSEFSNDNQSEFSNDNQSEFSDVSLLNSKSDILFTSLFIRVQIYEEETHRRVKIVINVEFDENESQTSLEFANENEYELFQNEHDYAFAL